MNGNMNRRRIRWPLAVCLLFAACTAFLYGCITPGTTVPADGVASGSDRGAHQNPTPQARGEVETVHGIFPPSRSSEALVTTRVKSWQKDCEDERDGIRRYPFARQYRYTGQGMSVYSLRRRDDTFLASADIPGPDGKTCREGALIQINTLSITGDPVTSTVLSGTVWTPRTTAIGRLDLSGAAKATSNPEFDFESFKSAPVTIPFANGYAVNLFGQSVQEGGVIDSGARPLGNYVSEEEKPLYGRLIRSRRGTLEEVILGR